MIHYIVRLCIAAVAVLTSVAGCSAPTENEVFVKRQDRDAYGGYHFRLSMEDSLKVHTLVIYTMIDASMKDFREMPDVIPFHLTAVSPSGKRFMETVGLRKDDFVRKTLFSWQYESVYREGFIPSEAGDWTLAVKVAGEDRFRGLRGIGIKHIES